MTFWDSFLCVSCLSFSLNFFILINLILFPDYLEYVLSASSLKCKCLLGDASLVLLKPPFSLLLMVSLYVAQTGLGVLDAFRIPRTTGKCHGIHF